MQVTLVSSKKLKNIVPDYGYKRSLAYSTVMETFLPICSLVNWSLRETDNTAEKCNFFVYNSQPSTRVQAKHFTTVLIWIYKFHDVIIKSVF